MVKRVIAIVLVIMTLVSTLAITASVASYSTGSYSVTASSGVNVRKGAGTNYSKVGSATKGTTFTQAYNAASAFQKKEICRDALTRTCGHPEVAGKIGNCLAFQYLPGYAVTDIVSKFVVQELQDCDMELEHIDEHLMVQLKEMHHNSKYGARSVKDAVRTALTFTAYDRNIDKYKGKKVILSGDAENILISVVS